MRAPAFDRRRRGGRLTAAVLAVALAATAAACGGDDSDETSPTEPAGATTLPDDTPGSTPDDGTEPAATTAPATAGSAAQGGDLTVAFRQDIVGGVDPHGEATSSTSELWTMGLMYETLVRLAPGYQFEPLLAESWETSDDLLTWTFTLRDDVTFSDGTAFDAAAVQANFAHIFEVGSSASSSLGAYFGADDVEVVDDHTVAFHLSEPYSIFPVLLGQFPTGMASPTAIADGVDLTTEAVGTGPFLFESFSPGVEIKYAKNPTYWGTDDDGVQLPYLDTITYKVITDASQRLNAVRTGETDVAMFLDVSQREQLGDAVAVIDPTSRLGVLTLNSDNEAWADPNVRRAFSLALDREALLQVAQGGVGEVAYGMFPSASDYYDPAVETPEGAPYSHRNIDEAKALLAEAGYPDGLDLGDQTIMAQAEWPDMVRAAEAALQMLGEAGIKFGGVQVCPLSECGEIRRTGQWAATTFAFPFPGEPYYTFEQLFTPTGLYNHGNGLFENRFDLGAEVDAAVDAPLRVAEAERFELARVAQQLVLEAQPGSAIQMFFMPQFDATGADVVNYDVRPYNLQREWASVGFAS